MQEKFAASSMLPDPFITGDRRNGAQRPHAIHAPGQKGE
jgi:hypothetical protein